MNAITTDDLLLLHEYRRRQRASKRPPLTFRGAAAAIQGIRHSCEFLLCGPYETGKTFSALYLLDTLLRTFPGSRASILRKVRLWLNGTALETWRNVIALRGGVTVYGGERPEWYDYENGSRVFIGGLDNPGNSLSGERDFIYVNQAEELTQEDWETIGTRATGRAAHAIVDGVPIGIVFGDCNPGPADHWILRRPTLKIYESHHEDNPTLYDEQGRLTPRGVQTMAKLDALTGIRYQRGRLGMWVGAEGQFFEQWDEARHVCEPFPIPHDWPIWGAFDYGFVHNTVFGVFTRNEGTVYLIGEHVQNKWTIAQHATAMHGLLSRLGIAPSRLRQIVAGHDVFSQRGDSQGKTIADQYTDYGFRFERADIDRINGASAMLERLGNVEAGQRATFKVFTTCQRTIATIPAMVHDPHRAEDVLKVDADSDGNGGDDAYDMARYGVMVVPLPVINPNAFAALSSKRKV